MKIQTKYKQFIKENKLVNDILDKISDKGMDSLSGYEKRVLYRNSNDKLDVDNREEDIKNQIEAELDLKDLDHYTRKGIGDIEKIGFVMLDSKSEIVFDLEISSGGRASEILYIYNDTYSKLKSLLDLTDEKLNKYLKEYLNKKFKQFNFNKVNIRMMFKSI
jgi:hypothetical protein